MSCIYHKPFSCRVSQKWKHLVSLPEVNEVVMVDDSCEMVSAHPLPSVGRVKRRRGPTLISGFPEWPTSKDPGVEQFRSGGLMGAHVHTIIWMGGRYPDECEGHQAEAIGWIGLFCKNVRHIVLCGVELGGKTSR